MKNDLLFVADTNVIVSALIFEHSTPGQAFYGGIEKGKILLSGELVHELKEVLSRTKFDRYLALEDRERFLAGLLKACFLVEMDQSIQACRDLKDNHILELAVCGQATCIISGDKDLLVLNPFRDIPILTPAQFIAVFLENSLRKPK